MVDTPAGGRPVGGLRKALRQFTRPSMVAAAASATPLSQFLIAGICVDNPALIKLLDIKKWTFKAAELGSTRCSSRDLIFLARIMAYQSQLKKMAVSKVDVLGTAPEIAGKLGEYFLNPTEDLLVFRSDAALKIAPGIKDVGQRQALQELLTRANNSEEPANVAARRELSRSFPETGILPEPEPVYSDTLKYLTSAVAPALRDHLIALAKARVDEHDANSVIKACETYAAERTKTDENWQVVCGVVYNAYFVQLIQSLERYVIQLYF